MKQSIVLSGLFFTAAILSAVNSELQNIDLRKAQTSIPTNTDSKYTRARAKALSELHKLETINLREAQTGIPVNTNSEYRKARAEALHRLQTQKASN